MREWLNKANSMNSQAKSVCGFQGPYEADFDAMQVILAESISADEFSQIYEGDEVNVYEYVKQRKSKPFKLYGIKYIASLIGYEAFLVVSGLIAVNRDEQLYPQVKRAKKALLRAVADIWGIAIRKKEA